MSVLQPVVSKDHLKTLFSSRHIGVFVNMMSGGNFEKNKVMHLLFNNYQLVTTIGLSSALKICTHGAVSLWLWKALSSIQPPILLARVLRRVHLF